MALKNVKLSGGAKYDAEKLRQAQNLALAQAMLQQSIAPEGKWTIDSGKYLVPDWGKAIGKLGQAYFGRKGQDESISALADIAARREAEVSGEMRNFNKARFGYEGTGNAPVGGMEGPPVVDDPSVQADKRKAIAMALSSGFPEVSKQGEELQKGLITDKDALQFGSKYNLQSLGQAIGPGGTFDPSIAKSPIKTDIVNGEMVASQDGSLRKVTPVTAFEDPAVDPNTGAPGQIQKGTNKFTSAGTFGRVTPENAGDVEMAKENAKAKIKAAETGREANAVFARQIGTFDQLPDLIRATNPNIAADLRVLARRLGEVVGISVDVSKIDSYQTLKSALFPSMIALLHQMGTGQSMSDKDAIRAIEGALASPVFNADAMIRAQGMLVADRMNKAEQHYMNVAETIPRKDQNYYFAPLPIDESLPKKYGLSRDANGSWKMPLQGALPGAMGQTQDLSKMSDEELQKIIRGGK